MESVARPAAVALSSAGNQPAASLVMEPRISGCPTAMPTWATNTRVRSAENAPRARAPAAVSRAPALTARRNPRLSITQAEGMASST